MLQKKFVIIQIITCFLLFSMCKKDKKATSPGGPDPDRGFNTNIPTFSDFSPETAAVGDTITIMGDHLDIDPGGISISFGTVKASVVNVSATAVRVIVPVITEQTTKITLKAGSYSLTSAKDFKLKLSPAADPVFLDFSPKNAFIGDTIFLTGKGFGVNPRVAFGSVPAEVVAAAENLVKVIVPDNIEEASTKITLHIGEHVMTSNDNFNLNAPAIASISPLTGFPGQRIAIKGKGFRNSNKFDQVTFGGASIRGSATSAGRTELGFPVPGTSSEGRYPVSVEVAGMKTTAADQFEVIVPVITSITPDSSNLPTVLTIKGRNFVDINGGATGVAFRDFETGLNRRGFFIRSLKPDVIEVYVTDIPKGKYRVEVTVLGATVKYDKPFIYSAD